MAVGDGTPSEHRSSARREALPHSLWSVEAADSGWTVVARNLPEHARNPIHTDAGARAAGFERALVAGVTSYAYCCHVLIDRFGLEWVASGEAEVRFKSPVLAGDRLRFLVSEPLEGLELNATTARVDRPLVTVSARCRHRDDGAERPGERLRDLIVQLGGDYGPDYALRAGDDQRTCVDAGVVHPAVWPALANSVFHNQLALGPWVHTRSHVRHHALVPAGVEADVAAVVVRRYPSSSGVRAIADVTVLVEGNVVATVEHEAIIELPGRPADS